MRYVLLLITLGLLLTAAPAPRHAAQPAGVRHGELILRLDSRLTLAPDARAAGPGAAELNQALDSAGVTVALPLLPGSDTYRLRLADSADLQATAQRLAAHTGVIYAEPNATRRLLRESTDPVVRQQWALRNIEAAAAWDITTGTGIMIAVLDTGVSRSHPDLAGRVLPGYDFHNNDANAADDNGHGTYVAGVAAADGANGIGIAGLCWACTILPVKVLGAFGNGEDASIAAGIRWAVDQGARIIVMSLGGDDDTQVMREAVAYARERGALLIAASGNGQADGNAPSYPAAYPEVLAVSATDGSDIVTGFSTTGDFVDISAPGVGVWSTAWEGGRDTYAASNGTSAACPYVGGAAALLLSIRPELTADQLAGYLTASADDRGAPGRDPENGYGRLNVARALQMAISGEAPPPAPAPAATPSAAAEFAPVAPPTDGTLYFPQTGHTLSGTFRAFWEQHGGLAVFGYPISREFRERSSDGQFYTVQYFERHRFELHPANQPPYHVLLSLMGRATLERTGRDWNTFPKGGAQNGCLFFAETGQSICEPFLSYWRSQGLEFDGRRGTSLAESLALFGLPISPPQTETLADGNSYTVQWFERARFEDHGAQGVLLGLLAADLARDSGWRP
jgi:subtilisin family serine protease